MDPIAQRLKAFLEHKSLTSSAFCRIMKYRSCEKVARLFRGENAKPSVDILEDIANYYPELNIRWLITGKGNMLEDEPSAENPRMVVVHSADILREEEPAFVLENNQQQLPHLIEEN